MVVTTVKVTPRKECFASSYNNGCIATSAMALACCLELPRWPWPSDELSIYPLPDLPFFSSPALFLLYNILSFNYVYRMVLKLCFPSSKCFLSTIPPFPYPLTKNEEFSFSLKKRMVCSKYVIYQKYPTNSSRLLNILNNFRKINNFLKP